MASPLDVVDWPVRTERLVLRRLADGDVAQIFAYRSQPHVAEWIGGICHGRRVARRALRQRRDGRDRRARGPADRRPDGQGAGRVRAARGR
ncbi:hypothetical protein AERO9AM_70334 [Aeromicrobium sp. 9AM]|nr:hypothetical protein AERO9AM_70334 [Aeromicrobium sp. 9AM]